jgi:O-antigen/teichoic acid export membrane protein
VIAASRPNRSTVQVSDGAALRVARDFEKDAEPSLRKNFSWALSGNVVYAAAQWGILVVVAKLGTVEMVGQLAFAFAVAAPVFLFANLQLNALQISDSAAAYSFERYLVVRLLTTTAAVLVVLGIDLAATGSETAALVLLFVATGKAVDAISDIYVGRLQRAERLDAIASYWTVNGLMSLTLVATLMFVTRSVVWVAIGSLGGSVAAFVTTVRSSLRSDGRATDLVSRIVAVRQSIRLSDPSISVWNVIVVALPVGLAAMMVSLTVNVPRYFLQRSAGDRVLGFFAAIAYLLTPATIVIGALGQAVQPRLAAYWRDARGTAFARLMMELTAAAIALGLFGILGAYVAGRLFLSVVYTAEYGAYDRALLWIMVAAGVGHVGSVFGYALNAARQFKSLPVVYGVVLLSATAASAFLVPPYGILGAVWSVAIANTVACLLSGALVLSTTIKSWPIFVDS